jgi:hypothetical protein
MGPGWTTETYLAGLKRQLGISPNQELAWRGSRPTHERWYFMEHALEFAPVAAPSSPENLARIMCLCGVLGHGLSKTSLCE